MVPNAFIEDRTASPQWAEMDVAENSVQVLASP